MQDVGEGRAREKVTWYLTFDTEPLRKVFHAKGTFSAKGLRQNVPGKLRNRKEARVAGAE